MKVYWIVLFPYKSDQDNTWQLLDLLSNKSCLLLLVAGDWNEILSQDEKLGSMNLNPMLMHNFKNVLSYNELVYLGFLGRPFTWFQGHELDNWIYERLDCACASMEWTRLFPHYQIWHLLFFTLDHCPIFIDNEIQSPCVHSKRQLQFEEWWLSEDDLRLWDSSLWYNIVVAHEQYIQWDTMQLIFKSLHLWAKYKKKFQCMRNFNDMPMNKTLIWKSKRNKNFSKLWFNRSNFGSKNLVLYNFTRVIVTPNSFTEEQILDTWRILSKAYLMSMRYGAAQL